MKKQLIISVLLIIMAFGFIFSGTGHSGEFAIYREDFASGNTLSERGFNGLEPSNWTLDTTGRYMKSTCPDKNSPAQIFTPAFSANRDQGKLVVTWKVNYLSSKPGKAWGENNRTIISLADAGGSLRYTLHYIPHAKQDQWKDPDLELYKDGQKIATGLTGATTPTFTFISFKMELSPRTAAGGDGTIKVYIDLGSGYTEFISIVDNSYAAFAKLHFKYQTGNGGQNFSIAIDDLQVLGTDNTAPTTSHNYTQNGQWTREAAVIHFSAGDDYSGVAQTYYRINNGEAQTGTLLELAADGVYEIEYWSVDKAGNTEAAKPLRVLIDRAAPVLTGFEPAEGSSLTNPRPVIAARVNDALSGVNPAGVQLLLDGQPVTGLAFDVSSGMAMYTPDADLAIGSHTAVFRAGDQAGNTTGEMTVSFTIISSGPTLPPDPATVAPPLDPTIATDLGSATKFLYTGTNPIQTGVDPETIQPRRAAVIRGKLLDYNNNPLSGVVVTILNHPEFGQTLSRADGGYDMAVNGGGLLTVNYAKDGYLSAQRQENVPWQDYALIPDLILIKPDSRATPISLTETAQFQVAKATISNDSDGQRQAALFFPPGTKVNGFSGDTIHVRATEFTVGPNGPKMMPAELPPASGYTYCVDLSIDGMANATFNKPIYFYLENFLDFPVGGAVPAGYYDAAKAAWIPSDDGRVIQILAITNGLAEIDVSGSGQPADAVTLTALGFSDAERQKLAATYAIGVSLWRAPVKHFTPWDCNWPFGPPPDAAAPNRSAKGDQKNNQNCKGPGSIIEIQNQILREQIAVPGTSVFLSYASDRVPGYKAARMIEVSLSDDVIPIGVKAIELEVLVGGRTIDYRRAPPNPNQKVQILWDGKDAYGRATQDSQIIQVNIGYVYEGYYYGVTASLERSFGRLGNDTAFRRMRLRLAGGEESTYITVWQQQRLVLRNTIKPNIGAWSLSAHHSYDPVSRTLYLGTGERVAAEDLNGKIISTFAGNPNGIDADNIPAFNAKLGRTAGVAVAGDGTVYFTETVKNRLRKVTPDGTISTIASGFYNPMAITIGPDGNIYVADLDRYRICKVTPDGVMTTVAGGAGPGRYYIPDGQPATSGSIGRPAGVAVGRDGTIYFSEAVYNKIRIVGTDGIIHTYAGTGVQGFSGDGGLATEAQFRGAMGLALDQKGNLYIADEGNGRIRKVTPAGIITTIAGTLGSGGGNLEPRDVLHRPYAVTAAPDGCIYICDMSNSRIRRLNPDGSIITLAGIGNPGGAGFTGDGGLATRAKMTWPYGIAVGPDNVIYFSDEDNYRIRQVATALPGFMGFGLDDIIVCSQDSSELYQFNANGRHLKTIDAITGRTLLTFTYDTKNNLIAVVDDNNNTTTIERDADGNPTAIMGPFGQRTTLKVNSEGYLESITNAANELVSFTYHPDGLLKTLTDPKNGLYQFTFDDWGRLTLDTGPGGSYTTLERTETTYGHQVREIRGKSGAETYITDYLTENLPSGEFKMTTWGCCGGKTIAVTGVDGVQTITKPDGTITTVTSGPDPRFGMMAPIMEKMTTKTPSGKLITIQGFRAAVLADPNNQLSLTKQTDTIIVNGKTSTSVLDLTAKTLTATTPMGRTSTAYLDERGRVIRAETPGLAATYFDYDERGRLYRTTEGSGALARVSSVFFRSDGLVDYVLDPLNRRTSYQYDTVGRLLKQVLPGGREISFSYDANGNMTSLTPPGRSPHGFTYNAGDLTTAYNPPDVGGNGSTAFQYNLAKQPTLVTRPDGQTIGFEYDTRGRLLKLLVPEGSYTYAYHVTTGHLSGIIGPTGEQMLFTYDGSLPLSMTWDGVFDGSVNVTYNNDFQVITQSVNGANPISFTYDNDGLLKTAGNLTLDWNLTNGMLTGTVLGNTTDTITPNTFGELDRYQAFYNGTSIFDIQYGARDKLGRITTKTETINGETHSYAYVYDPDTDRLTDVYKDGVLASHYEYDTNGNRLRYTGTNGTFTGVYDAQDRLLAYGNHTYEYTANGELSKKVGPEGQTQYVYDVLGNLRVLILPDGKRIEYIIDAENRRVGKKVNGVFVQGFLYHNQLAPIAELNASGQVIARFIYAAGRNIPDYMIKGGITYRIVSDHLGSPRLVVNTATGVTAQKIEYDEFGNVVFDTNPGFQPFGFAGGLYDQDTKLIRFGFRDYDSHTGRWTNPDPIHFNGGDTNLYAYCFSDPINMNDPSGLVYDVLDVGFFAWSLKNFIDCPDWGTGGELLLDTISLLPVVPSIGYITKIDDAYDIAKGIGKTAEELIPGALKRSKSYSSELANKTRKELEKLAKEGGKIGQKAQQMLKLIKEQKRLGPKVKGK
jgi:RHS repeat-associated protein